MIAAIEEKAMECCLHCGQHVDVGMLHYPYCCSGCQFAYQFLNEQGLSDFYALRSDTGIPIGETDLLGEGLLNWVDAALKERHLKQGELSELKCELQGIHCSACVWLIEKLFHRLEGAGEIILNPSTGALVMRFDQDKLDVRRYLADLWKIGYRTAPIGGIQTTPQLDRLFIRFGVSFALTMNSMMLSLSTYFGLGALDEPFLYSLFMWANWILTCLNVIVGGFVFIHSAAFALKNKILHLDLPIAVGIILTFSGSTWAFFGNRESAVYFDTVNVFITLMLLGRILMRRVVEQNKKRLLNEGGMDRIFVRTLASDNTLKTVPMAHIAASDQILLVRGDIVPVDAILQEDGSFSYEWINGESQSLTLEKGVMVHAGAIYVGRKPLWVTAQNVALNSKLTRLLASSQEQDGSWNIPLLPNLSSYYVVGVMVLASLGFYLYQSVSVQRGLDVAIAILVVTCPCALGLAMPLAIDGALANLRKLGFFVRRVDFLQRLLQVQRVVFDKTGTLTLSEPCVDESCLIELSQEDMAVCYQMALSSNHPKSKAIAAYLKGFIEQFSMNSQLSVEEHEGLGLQAFANGYDYRLGSSVFTNQSPMGHSKDVLFTKDGQLLQSFSFVEQLKYDVKQECEKLRQAGYALYLLSGDNQERVETIAHQLHISNGNCFFNQTPEEKAEVVNRLDHQDTLMIGDGINDSLAFEKAYCRGTPAAHRPTLPNKADFYYWGVGIGPLMDMVLMVRRLKWVLRRNLIYALSYNVLAVGLSFAGYMTPIMAAILMPSSSILIVFLTLFSMRRRS